MFIARAWFSCLLVCTAALLLSGCGRAPNLITIRAEGMRFVRDEVHLRAGEDVTVRLVNRDEYPHAFDLDEFDIHIVLAANTTEEITINPDHPGAYSFYCGAPGHTAAGMVGTLHVAP